MFFIVGDVILSIHELAAVTSLPPIETRMWLRNPPYCKLVIAQPNPLTGSLGQRLSRGTTPFYAATALGLIYLPLDNVAINPLIDPTFSESDHGDGCLRNAESSAYRSRMIWGTPSLSYPLHTPLVDIKAIIRNNPPLTITTFDISPTGHLIERPILVGPFISRST
jgi:hypothetical protein